MVNTTRNLMIKFPESITAAERELILQAKKSDKVECNLYLTPDALAVIEDAKSRFGAPDRTKAVEIILREYREMRRKRPR